MSRTILPAVKRKTGVTDTNKVTTMNENNAVKLDVRNYSAFFGANQVLFNLNLQIRQNNVVAIIGPSGCGKSTFLRSINRMHEINGGLFTGSIFFDGKDIQEYDPVILRRKIGMVFQKPNPFPNMSVFDNVVAGIKFNGIRKKSLLNEIAEKSLKQAALWDEVKDRLHTSAMGLSGGQQQRLCIARTLAVEPEVILMDEPASALDPISTAKIEELIFELKKNYTIVIVTHNMQQAARVSDFTCFLMNGKLIEFNETNILFTNPEEKITENYITGRFG